MTAGRAGREPYWMSVEESSGKELFSPAAVVASLGSVYRDWDSGRIFIRMSASCEPREPEVDPIPGVNGGGVYQREVEPIPSANGGGVYQRFDPLGSADEEPEQDPFLGAISRGVYQRSDSPTVGSPLGSGDGELEVDLIPSANGGGVHVRADTPIGSVEDDFISPPASDLLPGEEGAPPRDVRVSTRSSARLMSVRRVSALDRAKMRNAVLLEGEISGSASVRCQRSSKKVLKKSALCGVKLTGVEAEELHLFLLRG